MPSVYFDRVNVAVEINRKSGHTALANGGIKIRIHVLELLFEDTDIEIIGVMTAENRQNLLLNLGIRGDLLRNPYTIVTGAYCEGRKIF